MKTDYQALNTRLEALIGGIPYKIANLANAAALLYTELENINWAGFYLLQEGALVLGPFQGKPACIRIALGRGVCGTAAETGETQRVPDVHRFPGHIACDCASNSEIVIPMFAKGALVGMLDIDSPLFERFDEADQLGLEAFVHILERETDMW